MPQLTKSSDVHLADRDSVVGASAASSSSLSSSGHVIDETIVPARYPGRWIAAGATLLLLAVFGKSIVTNPGYQWEVVWEYLLNGTVIRGFFWTLGLTAA